MPDKPSYVGAAFRRAENIIGLGGLCVAGVLFNPGFLFLAGAAEIAYLWALGSNERFKRVVDSQTNRLRSLFDAKEKDRMLLRLPGEERDRYLELANIRQRVYESWQARDAVAQGLLQPSVDKLDYLLDTFLRAQMTLSLMREHLMESNRAQLERQVKSTEQELKHDLPESLKECPLYLGGPVQPTALSYLHADSFIPDANVLPNLTLGHSLDALMEIGESFSATRKVKMFAGYAGWSPGQLEDEMKRQAWLTHPASVELVFETDPDQLWRLILERKGWKYKLLAQTPEDLSAN